MDDDFDSDAALAEVLKWAEEANEITRLALLDCDAVDASLARITKLTDEFVLPFPKLDDYDLDEYMEKVSPSKLRPAKYYKVPNYVHSVMMPIGSPVITDEQPNELNDSDMDTIRVNIPPLIPTSSFSLAGMSPIGTHRSNKATSTVRAQSTLRKQKNFDGQRTLRSSDDSDDEMSIDDNSQINLEKTLGGSASLRVDDWAAEVTLDATKPEFDFSNF